jgi:SseB protein N-terminal domain
VFNPNNDLEGLLLGAHGDPAELGVFFQRLFASKVVVLVKEGPEQQGSPLHIAGVHGALVLAVFTRLERATIWAERYPEYGNALVVDARWAIGTVRRGVGMAINPGHAIGFEVSPERLPKLLKDFGVAPDAS